MAAVSGTDAAGGVGPAAGVPDAFRRALAPPDVVRGRRRPVRPADADADRPQPHPQRAQPAAETLPALQRRHRARRRLLRDPLERRQHRRDQQRAHRVSEPLPQTAQRSTLAVACTFYIINW